MLTGSVDFLYIILIGSILYLFYIICLSYRRTKVSCVLIYMFKNIVISKIIYMNIIIIFLFILNKILLLNLIRVFH